ncbi:YihY family inner membrane protein [Planctomycetota bacterium]|nr:YihY family inner membrane protein [Planctomycetota bacterium]
MSKLTNFLASIKRILTTPVDELSRAQLHLRNAIELVFFCGRKMKDDRATQMAAALTYRTIFSLVPLTVLALLIFKAFGGFSGLGVDAQHKLYDYLGFSTLTTQFDQPAEQTAAPPEKQSNAPNLNTEQTASLSTNNDAQSVEATEEEQSALDSVDQFFANLNHQVENINFTGIGFIGIAVLIWSAVSLLVTIERSFNTIYQCPAGRAWHMRITIYWAIITLGPVLIAISIFVANRAFTFAQTIPGLSAMFSLLSTFTALLTTWLLLLALYTLMPNTRVIFRPALMGALVAAILWELGKYGFKLYVVNALSASSLNSALYGSLGLVLIFLLWVYTTWLIIVFGLEITSTLQLLPGQRLKNRQQQSSAISLLSSDNLLLFMAATAHNFQNGESTTAESLSQILSLPIRSIDQLAVFLAEKHLIHRLSESDAHDRAYTLAQPPHDIMLEQLITLAHEQTTSRIKDTDVPASQFLTQLIETQLNATRSQSLADIVNGRNKKK